METPVEFGRTRPSPAAAAPSGPLTRSAPFHLLAKPTGPICNLDCEYCFFLSKEALYPGDRFRMSDELLDTYLRQFMEANPDGEITIAWQGGEPTLMGVDFFRRAVALAEQYRRPGPAGAAHHPDQRHAADRRVVRAPGRAPLPGGDQHRRAAGAARPVPGRQAG